MHSRNITVRFLIFIFHCQRNKKNKIKYIVNFIDCLIYHYTRAVFIPLLFSLFFVFQEIISLKKGIQTYLTQVRVEDLGSQETSGLSNAND